MIKNIVFDIGNVLVRWDTKLVIHKTFPQVKDQDQLNELLFKNPIWYDLNLGKITMQEAVEQYHRSLNIDKTELEELMHNIKITQIPLPGSIELVKKVYNQGFNLYILSDNIKEIIAFFIKQYDFWHYFKGMIISAQVGFLKPSREIYTCLLKTYNLVPQETLFLDDLEKNVEGAKIVGINAIQFANAEKCIEDFKQYNIILT